MVREPPGSKKLEALPTQLFLSILAKYSFQKVAEKVLCAWAYTLPITKQGRGRFMLGSPGGGKKREQVVEI